MDTTDLVVSRIKALLELDSNNALEPKLSGHVRTVLKAASEVIEANCPDTIQLSREEYEALRRDAELGFAYRKMVEAHESGLVVDFATGDIRLSPERDAAINMPANCEGGE
jgi:hypothetical protein